MSTQKNMTGLVGVCFAKATQIKNRKEKTMTFLEMQKHVLALNNGQRLALIVSLINHFKNTEFLSKLGLEQWLTAWQPTKKFGERG